MLPFRPSGNFLVVPMGLLSKHTRLINQHLLLQSLT